MHDSLPGDGALAELARNLGVSSLDQHLYELPLVARKRMSWFWPTKVRFQAGSIGPDSGRGV